MMNDDDDDFFLVSLSEGPTSGGVEQYEVMEVDEEASGGDGPGPQRCKLLFSLVSYQSKVSCFIYIRGQNYLQRPPQLSWQ